MISLQKAKALKIKKALAKGYRKHPETHDFQFLLRRLRDEINELEFQVVNVHSVKGTQFAKIHHNDIMLELADCYNFLGFIHKKIRKEFNGGEG